MPARSRAGNVLDVAFWPPETTVTAPMTRHRPTFEEFAGRAGAAACVPVYRQLTGDGLTPVSAFARIERTAPSFLFESVIGGEKVGRFSFLGTEPFLRFQARGREVVVTSAGDPQGTRAFTTADPFVESSSSSSGTAPFLFPGFRASPAAPSATRPTTPSATPNTCPTPRPTTAVCPTSRSHSTTGW